MPYRIQRRRRGMDEHFIDVPAPTDEDIGHPSRAFVFDRLRDAIFTMQFLMTRIENIDNTWQYRIVNETPVDVSKRMDDCYLKYYP